MSLAAIAGDATPPGLVKEPVYYCNVSKKQVSSVIAAMRTLIPPKSVDMQHIKRVQPVKGDLGKLSVMLCFVENCTYERLSEILLPLLKEEFELHMSEAARFPARSKEETVEWSRSVWPLMWRGNISAQPPSLDPVDEKAILHRCLHLPTHLDSSLCCDVCFIVDPAKDEVLGSAVCEEIDAGLDHSVMRAIREVAKNTDDDVYLCLGFDVYCSQEPCIMCCMALVHSRIGRLIFKNKSRDSKSSIRFFKLHGRAQLNHTFQAWKYTPEINA